MLLDDLRNIEWTKNAPTHLEQTGGQMILRNWYATIKVKPSCTVVGVDPGRNFGITCIKPDGSVVLIVSRFPESRRNLYGFTARTFFAEFLENSGIGKEVPTVMGIEGPSFHDNFGQVVLAEIRMGFCIAAMDRGISVTQYAPMTSRKSILGNGKMTGSDLWVHLPDHGADSFVIALHTIKDKL